MKTKKEFVETFEMGLVCKLARRIIYKYKCHRLYIVAYFTYYNTLGRRQNILVYNDLNNYITFHYLLSSTKNKYQPK